MERLPAVSGLTFKKLMRASLGQLFLSSPMGSNNLEGTAECLKELRTSRILSDRVTPET